MSLTVGQLTEIADLVKARDIVGIERWVDEVASGAAANNALNRIASALEAIAERLDTNSSNGTFDVTTREAT